MKIHKIHNIHKALRYLMQHCALLYAYIDNVSTVGHSFQCGHD